jgi:hypothetical protein
MKTFKQFLDEALVASLVKAATRSLLRNKAITQKVASTMPPRTLSLPRKITGFQTARGSKYTYQQKPKSWPQTQRTAPQDPYHPTSAGTKQKSDWTLFTTPKDSMTMRQRFVSGSKEPFHQGLPQSTRPKIGRAPVEVWNQYVEKGGKSVIHPGSRITDIQTATPGSGVGLYGAQRKELADRVKVELKRPANIEALKKELEMKSKSPSTYRNLGAGRIESVKENKIVKDYESVRQEDDIYQTVQQKLANPRLRKLRRYLNREVGRYTV